MYGTSGIIIESLSFAAMPSPAGRTFVFEAQAPTGDFAGWGQQAGLAECIPSYYNPGEWPVIAEPGRAWHSLRMEVRANAVLAQRVGLGSISFEYQAQIEQMRWTPGFNALVGRPKIHYVLVLQKDIARRGLALTTQFVSDSHLQEVTCFAPSGVYEPILHLKFKTNFLQTMCAFSFTSGDLGDLFYSETKLAELTRNAYAGLAQSINQELRTQLNAPDSALGAAGRTLTRVTELIRGMAEWLVPDLVASHDGLRTALRGPLVSWQTPRAGRVLENWVKSEFSAYPGLPLFDGDTLRGLVAGETAGADEDATMWPGTRLLTHMETYLKLSKTAFRTSLRQARAVGGPGDYLHPVAKMVSDLELFARVVPPSEEAGLN